MFFSSFVKSPVECLDASFVSFLITSFDCYHSPLSFLFYSSVIFNLVLCQQTPTRDSYPLKLFTLLNSTRRSTRAHTTKVSAWPALNASTLSTTRLPGVRPGLTHCSHAHLPHQLCFRSCFSSCNASHLHIKEKAAPQGSATVRLSAT